MNLLSIAKQYADADSAREFFEKQRWPDGVVCLFCGLVGEAYRWTKRRRSGTIGLQQIPLFRNGVIVAKPNNDPKGVRLVTRPIEGELQYYLQSSTESGKVGENSACVVYGPENVLFAKYPEAHQQVFTGLGFTCDAEILPFVISINKDKYIQSSQSCQASKHRGWFVLRRMLSVRDKEQNYTRLLEFMLHVRRVVTGGDDQGGYSGYQGQIRVDGYHVPSYPCAILEWTPDLDKTILQSLNDWTSLIR